MRIVLTCSFSLLALLASWEASESADSYPNPQPTMCSVGTIARECQGSL